MVGPGTLASGWACAGTRWLLGHHVECAREGPRPVSPVRIRPLGGAFGCLIMILVSVALSVLLTIVLNLGR